MADEPDISRRRPPTIELKATEVEAEKPASTQQSDAPDPAGDDADVKDAPAERTADDRSGRSRSGAIVGAAVGVAVGALAVAAIVFGLWMAGFSAVRNAAAPIPGPGSQPADPNGISAQLDKIEAALAAQRPEAALAERLAATEAQTKSLGDSLAALNRRVDDIAAAAQNALARANTAAANADGAKNTAQASVQRSDVEALTGRIAALERAVKTLSDEVARPSAGADDRVARLTVATEALRAAVERGAPYRAELATVKSLGIGQSATAPLDPFAAAGVPSVAALAHELAALTPALLPSSEPGPTDTTFLGRLENNAQKLVRVTPADTPAGGDDAASIVARIKADAARADIAGALADIARLPESQRALADSWVKKADARNAAVAASRRIADDALAALGRPNSQ